MTKLYMVTHGDYSDYTVVGVFSTMSNALRIKKITESDRIEEITLDPGIDELRAGLEMYFVIMNFDGNVEECHKDNEIESSYSVVKPFVQRKNERTKRERILCNNVWAKDSSHAIKITNELRTRLIAFENMEDE